MKSEVSVRTSRLQRDTIRSTQRGGQRGRKAARGVGADRRVRFGGVGGIGEDGAVDGCQRGGTCEEDQQANAEDMEYPSGRLMGSYEHDGTKYWVISNFNKAPELQKDPDYCNTCILLPEDY